MATHQTAHRHDTKRDELAATGGACPACGGTARAWDEDDVAAFLGVSRRRVLELVGEDLSFPRPRHLGRARRWAPDAVPTWVAAAGDTGPDGRRRVGRRGTSRRV